MRTVVDDVAGALSGPCAMQQTACGIIVSLWSHDDADALLTRLLDPSWGLSILTPSSPAASPAASSVQVTKFGRNKRVSTVTYYRPQENITKLYTARSLNV